jgi:hypothetical protein
MTESSDGNDGAEESNETSRYSVLRWGGTDREESQKQETEPKFAPSGQGGRLLATPVIVHEKALVKYIVKIFLGVEWLIQHVFPEIHGDATGNLP